MIDGAPTYAFSRQAAALVQVIELDMASTPALAGQLTYFALRTTADAGALRLAIDRGDVMFSEVNVVEGAADLRVLEIHSRLS